MDILLCIYLLSFFFVFPLTACLLFRKYTHCFRGGRILIFILFYSLLSWIVTNGIIYLRYLFDPMSLQGPEGAFALFFGWIYLWLTSIPVFLVHLISRIISGIVKKKK